MHAPAHGKQTTLTMPTGTVPCNHRTPNVTDGRGDNGVLPPPTRNANRVHPTLDSDDRTRRDTKRRYSFFKECGRLRASDALFSLIFFPGPFRPSEDTLKRSDELQFAYDVLKQKLVDADGSGAASIARELRILSENLERLAEPAEVSKVDELAAKRSESGITRPPTRRRKSG